MLVNVMRKYVLPGHTSSCDQAGPTRTADGDKFEFLTFGKGKTLVCSCDIYSLNIRSRQMQFAPRF